MNLLRAAESVFHKVLLTNPNKRFIMLQDSIKRVIGPAIHRGVIVYERSAPPPEVLPIESLTFERHDSSASLEAALEDAWQDPRCKGLGRWDDYVTFVEQGAVAWIARVDGTVAQLRWTKAGRFVKGWYLRLAPDDLAFFGAVTLYGFRGRGVHGAMFRHVLAHEPHRRAYGDVLPSNDSARRVLEKVGFRPIFRTRCTKNQLHPETLDFHERGQPVTLTPSSSIARGSVGWHVAQLVKMGFWEQSSSTPDGLSRSFRPKSSAGW